MATSSLVELDGTISPQINNKLVLTLVKVERDPAPRHSNRPKTAAGAQQVQTVAPLYLNLYMMVAGHFAGRNYAEALKFLSATIAFFHQRPVLDHSSSPDLDQQIERLILEIENLSFSELASLWSIMGGKYMPSALYRIRTIAIDGDDVSALPPVIRAPETRVSGRSLLGESAAERDKRQKKADQS